TATIEFSGRVPDGTENSMTADDEAPHPHAAEPRWRGVAVFRQGMTSFAAKQIVHVCIAAESTAVLNELDGAGDPGSVIMATPLSYIRKSSGIANWVALYTGHERYRLQFTNAPDAAGPSWTRPAVLLTARHSTGNTGLRN